MTVKRIMATLACTFLLLGIVELAGCGNTSISVDVPFENTAWVLERYGPADGMKSVLWGTRITAVFFSGENVVRGSGGCNTYNGHYEIIGLDGLNIIELLHTEVACADKVNKQEIAYLVILSSATSFQVEHNTLTINGSEGTLVFKA